MNPKSLILVISIIVATVDFSLANYIFFENPRSKLHILSAVRSLLLSIFSMCTFMAHILPDAASASLWMSLRIVPFLLAFPVMLHFIWEWVSRYWRKVSQPLMVFFYSLTVALIYITLSFDPFTNMQPDAFGLWPSSGVIPPWLLTLWWIFTGSFLIGTLLVFFFHFIIRKNHYTKRRRRLILLGVILPPFMTIFLSVLPELWLLKGPGEFIVLWILLGDILIVRGISQRRSFLLTPGNSAKEIINSMTDGFILIDTDGIIDTVNPAFEKMFGWQRSDLTGHSLWHFIPTDRSDLSKMITPLLTEEKPSSSELVIPDRNGHPVQTLVKTSPIMDQGGEMLGVTLILTDITDRKQKEQEKNRLMVELRRLAEVDPLTDMLLNRRAFMDRANNIIDLFSNKKAPLSLIMLDIDHFKRINDTFGHLVGDQALIETARMISAQLRESDLLGRYGGEEFVILLPNTAPENALSIAKRLVNQIQTSQVISIYTELNLTVSIGVSSLDPSCQDLDQLLSRADQALYQAKAKGRNQAVLWGSADS